MKTMKDRRSILVCEDDPVQLALLSAALGQAGYDTVTARSPGEALEKVKGRPADAVVSDVRLESGDAFDVLGGMRRAGCDAPMLMVSGHADASTRGRAIEEGARGLLEKPLDLRALVRAVRALVERPAAPLRATVKVLVVEADDRERRRMAASVEGAGFRATLASGPESAIDLVRKAKAPFDVAVVDLRSAGARAVEELLAADPGVYVVMKAGTAGRETVRAGYRAGADSMIRGTARLADVLAGSLRASARKRAEAERRRRREGEPWTARFARFVGALLKPSRGPEARALRLQLGVAVASILAGLGVAAVLGWSIRESERSERRIEQALRQMESRMPAWPAERPAARAAAGAVPPAWDSRPAPSPGSPAPW
jgi:DNA-binding NtrC family response regulator